jgi:hypothetical protein
MPGLPHELARGADRVGCMVVPREAGNEKRDSLVADELVDDPVPAVDDPRRRPVKRASSWPKSPGDVRSAMPVDPRTSTKSAVTSISAPPGCLWRCLMHAVQIRRFSGEGLLPNSRMTTLPGRPKGARQSLHRGVEGIAPMIRLNRSRPGSSPRSI